MQGLEMLRTLKSVVVSTNWKNQPHARIVDMMHADDTGLYFITCSIKPFYKQLKENSHLAVTGMTQDYVQIRVSGQVQEMTSENINRLLENNAEMVDLFPQIKKMSTDEHNIWKAFHIYKGKGEIFDLSGKVVKMQRERFAFGGESVRQAGVSITSNCIECGKCKSACPFSAIEKGSPYLVNSKYCDECGVCYSVCPAQAITLPTGM